MSSQILSLSGPRFTEFSFLGGYICVALINIK